MPYEIINDRAVRSESGFAIEIGGRNHLFYVERPNILTLVCDLRAGEVEVGFPYGKETWTHGPRAGEALTQSEIERIRRNLMEALPELGLEPIVTSFPKRLVKPPDTLPSFI